MLNEDEIDAVTRTNAALTKRVAELEASVASNKHWFALAWNNLDRIRVLERLTDHLQSQLEAKDKRVAELEAQVEDLIQQHADMAGWCEDKVQLIASLQFQLAWTPVSAGLPTEPGVYEFTVGSIVHAFWLTEPGAWKRQSGRTLDARGISAVFSGYTHYRRIELPKDGGT